ncbi:MAG: hypothetical protein Q7R93_00415 [bacterium]|nr:hypothetical protein [bacterium]
MSQRKQKDAGETGWSFALLNGRLAEIYFEVGKGLAGISGHGYVNREWYKTKYEQKMIETDIKKYNLTYRNKKYRDKNRKWI